MQLLFLSSSQTPQGDPFALLILGVLVIALVIYLLVKNSKKKKAKASVEEVITEDAPKAVAPGSAGQIKLHDVAPKAAAMVMAIVADKLGKPLNELRFISIREVKDDEV